MKRHFIYFKNVLGHKWYVFWACIELTAPFYRAVIHDWVKFLPCEWTPYVHTFYNMDGSKKNIRDKSGAYDPGVQSSEFQRAWLHHQKQKHHWQAWILLGDSGSIVPLEIPETYVREMIADWTGAGRHQTGRKDPVDWYMSNRSKMILHPDTRKLLERILYETFPVSSLHVRLTG